jgi:hypothetical protein
MFENRRLCRGAALRLIRALRHRGYWTLPPRARHRRATPLPSTVGRRADIGATETYEYGA